MFNQIKHFLKKTFAPSLVDSEEKVVPSLVVVVVVVVEYVPVVGVGLNYSVDPHISAEIDDDSAPEQNIVYNKLLTSG